MNVSLERRDWSLHRKGPIDEARHQEKVREVLRENLPDIISKEAIITSDGQKIVRIPIRSLDLPRFRFDPKKQQHTGQGNGDSKVGDVIGQAGRDIKGAGQDKYAGDQPGIDYYEAEVSIDDLAKVLFEELGLPNLDLTKRGKIMEEEIKYDDRRRKGPMSLLDPKRTILENIRRNALAGDPHIGKISNEDLRFRAPVIRHHQIISAAVIAMRDISGSMGDFQKFMSRSFYFWMVRFLRTKYENVEMVFITHHTQAQEVDEQSFFSLGESGGTKVSPVYQLARDIYRARFDPRQWNIYPLHFTDGDNYDNADNQLCRELILRMLDEVNLFGLGEIREGAPKLQSGLSMALSEIKDPRLVQVLLSQRSDTYHALQRFFSTNPYGIAVPTAL